jgi:hypothetical protein
MHTQSRPQKANAIILKRATCILRFFTNRAQDLILEITAQNAHRSTQKISESVQNIFILVVQCCIIQADRIISYDMLHLTAQIRITPYIFT